MTSIPPITVPLPMEKSDIRRRRTIERDAEPSVNDATSIEMMNDYGDLVLTHPILAQALWPEFSQLATCILNRFTTSNLYGAHISYSLIESLLQMLTCILEASPQTLLDSPQLCRTLILSHSICVTSSIQRLLDDSIPPKWAAIVKQILEHFPTLCGAPAIADSLEAICHSCLKTLALIVTHGNHRPLYLLLRDQFGLVNHLSSQESLCDPLYQKRAIYWSIEALNRVIRESRRHQFNLSSEVVDVAHAALTYIHWALGYFGLDMLYQAEDEGLNVFRIVSQLRHLAAFDETLASESRQPPGRQSLQNLVTAFLARARPFVVHKSVCKKADRSCHSLKWLTDDSFVNFVEWITPHVMAYERAQVCANKKCTSVTSTGRSVDHNAPLRACGACRTVSYCSIRCQRKDWKSGYRIVCRTTSHSLTFHNEEGDEYPAPPIFREDDCEFLSYLTRKVLEDNMEIVGLHRKMRVRLHESPGPAIKFVNSSSPVHVEVEVPWKYQNDQLLVAVMTVEVWGEGIEF